MRTVTLANLIKSAQRYADMENSSFISQQEWIDYINNASAKYWNLINGLTQDYNINELYFALNFGQQDYALPTDFLYVRGVDVNISAGATALTDNWISVERYMLSERNVSRIYITTLCGLYYLKYRIQGNNLRFEPTPQAYQTARLIYTPVMPNLLNLTDTIDGINGFDDYIAMLSAARALDKEKSDNSFLMMNIQMFEAQVKAAADDRNRDQADRVQDVNMRNRWWF